LQLTFGRMVECIWDHVCLLDDLPNGTTQAQEIVASSVFPVTEILAIEYHKLNSTFLHVAFGSQNLLKSTSDQTSSDTNWKIEEGDQREGEWEPIKILLENLAYIPKSTRRPSLLTRSRPHNYRKAINPQNRVSKTGNTAEDNDRCKQNQVQDYDKNQIKTQFMSPQAFHRTPCEHVQKTTVRTQLELENLELFNPTSQE
jgi:hypothetical protein